MAETTPLFALWRTTADENCENGKAVWAEWGIAVAMANTAVYRSSVGLTKPSGTVWSQAER